MKRKHSSLSISVPITELQRLRTEENQEILKKKMKDLMEFLSPGKDVRFIQEIIGSYGMFLPIQSPENHELISAFVEAGAVSYYD